MHSDRRGPASDLEAIGARAREVGAVVVVVGYGASRREDIRLRCGRSGAAPTPWWWWATSGSWGPIHHRAGVVRPPLRLRVLALEETWSLPGGERGLPEAWWHYRDVYEPGSRPIRAWGGSKLRPSLPSVVAALRLLLEWAPERIEATRGSSPVLLAEAVGARLRGGGPRLAGNHILGVPGMARRPRPGPPSRSGCSSKGIHASLRGSGPPDLSPPLQHFGGCGKPWLPSSGGREG